MRKKFKALQLQNFITSKKCENKKSTYYVSRRKEIEQQKESPTTL